MKMKKILAAVLAGTMVFAMTVPVFAENRVTKRMQSNVAWECWWNGADDVSASAEASSSQSISS